jgi:hypothetical protein
MAKRSERALIILGAGASIEYGIPATASGWKASLSRKAHYDQFVL